MSPMLEGGFANPVLDSRAVFRGLLDAMATPGRIYDVNVPPEFPPSLDQATAAALLTLVDADTPIWLDERLLASREWITFHCGAPEVQFADARFAIASAGCAFAGLFVGTDEEPENSATLILQVDALDAGTPYRLQGPGLAIPKTVSIEGLPVDFVDNWEANRRAFPRGVDVILCAKKQIAGLPRTVQISAV